MLTHNPPAKPVTTLGKPIWKTTPTATPEEIDRWLTWAGGRLLCMQIRSPLPSGYRSYWPEYTDTYRASNRERIKVPAIAPSEVAIMDTILCSVSLISDPRCRRIVHARSLVTPLGNRHVNSYVKIALAERIDARLAARIYLNGISELAKRLPADKAYILRNFLTDV